MSDQDEGNEAYRQQLGGLTASVSRHEETLNRLKDVPDMLKNMASALGMQLNETGSQPPSNEDEESLSEESSESDLVQKMMNSSAQSGHSEGNDSELNAELMQALQDCEKGLEVGPPVHKNVAEAFNRTVKRPLSKETIAEIVKKVKIPENCKALIVPKVNTEIWSHLPSKVKISDLNWQTLQQTMAFAVTTLSLSSNQISMNVGSNEISPKLASMLLQNNMDMGNMLGNSIQQINIRRKADIKPFLNTDFAGICSNSTPVTEYLFGDDLKDTLKSSKTESSVMKQTFTRRSFRGKPYEYRSSRNSFRGATSFSQGSLNRQRPLWRPPKRGSGWNFQRSQNQTAAPLPNQSRQRMGSRILWCHH